MTRAFIAEYFDYAKKHGNDLALGFLQDKKAHWIPHWLIRSKAKHFALGLLDLETPEEGYFYLLPHFHPEWIYSLAAAQSLGLAVLPIPSGLETADLDHLMEKYPPSFVYGDHYPSETQWKAFKKAKTFKRFILGGSDHESTVEEFSTFRIIHNRGIMAESKYFLQYRERRESLTAQQLLSPIQVDAFRKINEHGLRCTQLQERFQTLEKHLHEKKLTQLFAKVDLSQTLDQIIALYWPLQTGKRVLLVQGDGHWLGTHPMFHPQIAFLSTEGVSNLAGALALGKAPLLKESLSFWTRRRAKKKLGGNLQEIWSTEPLGEEAQSLFGKLGIRLWAVEV